MKIKALYYNNKRTLLFRTVNKEIIIVTFIMVAAVITGSIIATINAICADEIKNHFINYLAVTSNNSIIKVFINIFISNAITFIIYVISGTSVYGKIPIIAITFYKVSGISAITAYLLKAYLLKGLEYSLLIFMPGKTLLIFALFYMAVNCLKASESIINIVNKKESAEYSKELFLKQSLLSFIILTVSALLDTVLLKLFLPLFEF